MSVIKMMKRSYLMAALVVLGVSAGVLANAQTAEAPVATHMAVIRTSMGDVELELYGLDAPKTVRNFIELAKKGFYNGILFHRVVPGFVVQAGDPKTRDTALMAEWGRGGESIYGGDFADELNPNAPSFKRGYVEGTLAMANRGPNTNTSQFFIMLANNTRLPKAYTIFGKVTKGMEIVRKMEGVPHGKTGIPKEPISILAIDTVEVKPTNR